MSEAVATPTCPGSCATQQEVDVSLVDKMVARIGRRPEDLIPLLQAIQHEFNYLPPVALERLCELTDITPDAVTGVSTFYSQFRHYPVGKHIIQTCIGTACHVSGANILDDTLRQHLKIKDGEHTTEDGQFTAEKVACLGCCMLAPVVQIDDVIYGNVDAKNVPKLITDFQATTELRSADGTDIGTDKNAVGDVRLCKCMPGCAAGGADKVFDELKKVVDELGLPVAVRDVGCSGVAFQTPLVEVVVYNESRYRYGRVKPGEVRQILTNHFKPASWFKRTGARIYQLLDDLLSDEAWQPPTRFSKDVRGGDDMRYVDSQVRVVTEYSGELNPVNIEDYIAHDGFKAMEMCLKGMEPDEIIKVISDSGLRGRGGAGFPHRNQVGLCQERRE